MRDINTSRDSILIVDDIMTNRMILANILEDDFDIYQAEDGKQALDALFSHQVTPAIVLLDIMMPGMSGFDVIEVMKADPVLSHISVLFITAADDEEAEIKGLRMGAVDYIYKPFRPEAVKTRVMTHLKLHKYNESLEKMVAAQVKELTQAKDKMFENMANIIEYRNLESGEHVKRTKLLTQVFLDYLIAHPMQDYLIDPDDYDIISKSVPLHDVGKIGIPDNVLLKPGSLTRDEYEIIKTHTTIGSEIILSMLDFEDEKYMNYCNDICRHHHERWDGTGYPDKLREAEIPLVARIVSIVDVYDALVSERVYKAAMSHEQALAVLNLGAGTQFDPYLIKVLNEIEGKFRETEAEI